MLGPLPSNIVPQTHPSFRCSISPLPAVATFASVYAVILASTVGTPKAAKSAYWRTLDFIGWFAATLQLLAQVVSDVPAEAVPPEVQWLFDLVQLSLLDVSRAVHPDCLDKGGVPFTTIHLAGVIGLAVVVMGLVAQQLRAVNRVEAAGSSSVPISLLRAVQGGSMLQGLLLIGHVDRLLTQHCNTL